MARSTTGLLPSGLRAAHPTADHDGGLLVRPVAPILAAPGPVKTLVSTASERLPRYGRAEIRILPAIEVGPLRRQMDELACKERGL